MKKELLNASTTVEFILLNLKSVREQFGRLCEPSTGFGSFIIGRHDGHEEHISNGRLIRVLSTR